METRIPKTLHYKRSRFVTQLPADYLYSPSHCWIARQEGDLWRVGLTQGGVGVPNRLAVPRQETI